MQRLRCCRSGSELLFVSRRELAVWDGVNGTSAHRSLPWPLLNAPCILSDKTAPEGQMPPRAGREYSCGCSGSCSALDKKGRKLKYCVPVPRPCPWPHSHTTQSTEATGSQCVSPLCIVSGFRSEAARGEPTSHSSLQKPSSSLFVCRQTGGITKGAAENQQCGKI